jgi:hypothetical protein
MTTEPVITAPKARSRIARWTSPALFTLVVIGFALPFATVSCDNAQTSFTGIQLVTHTVPSGGKLHEGPDCSTWIGTCVERSGSSTAQIAFAAALLGLALGLFGIARGPGWCAAVGFFTLSTLPFKGPWMGPDITMHEGYKLSLCAFGAAGILHAVRASRRRRARRLGAGETAPMRSRLPAGARGRLVRNAVIIVLAGVVGLAAIEHGSSHTATDGSPAGSGHVFGSVGALPRRVTSTANGLPGSGRVNAMFKGIPQRGLTLGSTHAPVTLVEYIELQCPYCRQFETQVLPGIVKRYVATGKVKIEARPLAFIGSDSSRGRNAMIAAGIQNKAFNFAELLYLNQGDENSGWLDDGMVADTAKSIPGLNPRQLFAVRSSAVKHQAERFDREGSQIDGTPTLFVGRSGRKGEEVPADTKALVQAIRTTLGA